MKIKISKLNPSISDALGGATYLLTKKGDEISIKIYDKVTIDKSTIMNNLNTLFPKHTIKEEIEKIGNN